MSFLLLTLAFNIINNECWKSVVSKNKTKINALLALFYKKYIINRKDF